MITKEWPPHIYGGAGVHVTNLVSALEQLPEISAEVHCYGPNRSGAIGHELSEELGQINPAFQALLLGEDISRSLDGIDLAHSHTWYANFAGHLASRIFDIPHVLTAHSLEPLRPWKAEQLGGGYQISSWIEKTAYENAAAIIAVSDGMRADVLKSYPQIPEDKVVTIRNGINTELFRPNSDNSILEKYGIKTPFALFVGRITRQKGLAHLLRAWRDISSEYTLVLAASSPDEPAIGKEVEQLISELSASKGNVIWIKEMLSRHELTALLTAARSFVCPSIYEPLGIVNLEAMACETAVVASRVGGIPEVVNHGETGLLVDYTEDSHTFEENLVKALNEVLNDGDLAHRMGQAGRSRAISEFGWDKVANQTLNLYRSVLK
ncbi:MAG: glycogen synthase [Candidatus Nanopelagicaceae bacterium]|nr:glycogen synthase [Candidatus Nanopelagicaceae bacterium]